MPQRDREKYNAYMAQYMARRYRERRAAAIEFLGGECVDCGARDDLEFDHKDPKEKEFTIAKLWSVSAKRLQAEIEKCVLRCRPCHQNKTRGEQRIRRPITHGRSYAAITKGCKCMLCSEHRLKYNARRREKRRAGRYVNR